ncbi:DUF397 domain-containing protein [Streptomyces sp. 15-116A]|uniref:DUF397 domain-containing protein n=1 Tax=Streptomyces sp. 15-116A TaxID=2259035 RepID=UPI0021B2E820|nr:DUF397 domain-containing protein [Streptomyces sp. 15-116A]MCT7353383.1 DUF397 domain-containing protein [Streptomyces sp. 15-116A]
MTHHPTGNALEWFKSSYSTNDGPECVEVAFAPHTIHVRDSKHIPGPQLAFSFEHWADFLAHASERRP